MSKELQKIRPKEISESNFLIKMNLKFGIAEQ